MLKSRQLLHLLKKAAKVIQRAIRNRRNRTKFYSSIATVVEETRMDSNMKLLLKKIGDNPVAAKKDDLLIESSK